MRRRQIRQLLWSVSFILFAVGCSGARHFAPGEDPCDGYRASERELEESILKLSEKVKKGPLRVLLLSGGGSRGAWGAGVLSGWRESGKRPEFHVVTGISTGALQATFAYLDTPGDDITISDAYLRVKTNDDIYSERCFCSIPFSDSIATVPGLHDFVWNGLTEKVMERVGEKYRTKGFVLAIGTTDLDSGVLRVWDVSRLAAGAPPYDTMTPQDRLEKYRKIILASASMPVIFPPVEIDGHLHVDGGVREQIFIREILLPAKAARLKQAARAGAGGLEAYALINGKLSSRSQAIRDSLLSITKRTLELMLDEGMVSALYKSAYFLNDKDYALWVMMVPPAFTPYPFPQDFVENEMHALYAEGKRWGKDHEWFKGIPEAEPCGSEK